MKITIQSTTKIVETNGIACRIWEGKTEKGIEVQVLIPRIAVLADQNCSEFEADLQEHAAPKALVSAFPARLIL